MPLYDYTCQNCGDFEAWRRMAEVKTPLPCPDCEAIATRLYIAPNISLNSSSLTARVGATAEPRLIQRQERVSSSPKHQSPRGGRPWMIGHASERL
ncbi:MAG: zinc ribbon domain-containing protein [Cyanobacteria bacterium P01_F01_bin.150]